MSDLVPTDATCKEHVKEDVKEHVTHVNVKEDVTHVKGGACHTHSLRHVMRPHKTSFPLSLDSDLPPSISRH